MTNNTSRRLAGKTALVTGSTRGLGRTIAEWLAREGASIIVSGREADAVEDSVRAIRALGSDAVGIPAELRMRPFEEYRAFVTSGQQALFTFGSVGVAPMQDVYLTPLFRSTSPDNVTGFRSADIDAQLAQAGRFRCTLWLVFAFGIAAIFITC